MTRLREDETAVTITSVTAVRFTIAMLVWALVPINPYSFYILLRWVVCAVLLLQLYVTRSRRRYGWMVACGIGAIIYNPLMTFQFPRATWSIINIATVLALFMMRSAEDRRVRDP